MLKLPKFRRRVFIMKTTILIKTKTLIIPIIIKNNAENKKNSNKYKIVLIVKLKTLKNYIYNKR